MAINPHSVIEKGSSCALLKFWAQEVPKANAQHQEKLADLGCQRNIQQSRIMQSWQSGGTQQSKSPSDPLAQRFDCPSNQLELVYKGVGGWKHVGIDPRLNTLVRRPRDHVLPTSSVRNSQF